MGQNRKGLSATLHAHPICPVREERALYNENDAEPDEGDGDEEWTIPCPYCQRAIHEDSQRCPYCEQYISDHDASPARKSWLILVGVALCLYVVYRWIAG